MIFYHCCASPFVRLDPGRTRARVATNKDNSLTSTEYLLKRKIQKYNNKTETETLDSGWNRVAVATNKENSLTETKYPFKKKKIQYYKKKKM